MPDELNRAVDAVQAHIVTVTEVIAGISDAHDRRLFQFTGDNGGMREQRAALGYDADGLRNDEYPSRIGDVCENDLARGIGIGGETGDVRDLAFDDTGGTGRSVDHRILVTDGLGNTV